MADTCILVVDDEESVATTIEAILKLDGHDVLAVTSGEAAIRLLHERQFDVVLTDLRLADIDGIEILREVQRTSPDTAAIMLTGYASLESAVEALRSGAYDYLMKPSDVEELRATVNRAIEAASRPVAASFSVSKSTPSRRRRSSSRRRP
ncbi:MAG TPA: response regulator, partial [Candidatus Acidoferrales bacterium]|nr:response regulator [Candidatus Acidoferrales bacterium]